MYDASDPRTVLTSTSRPAATPSTFAGVEYGRFDLNPPAKADGHGSQWYLRGQNFVLNYIEALPGGQFAREDQTDEYALILPDDDMEVTVAAGSENLAVKGGSVIFIPAGRSLVTARRGGRIIRLVTFRSTDMTALCPNAGSYALPHPNIPQFEPWPAAAGGDAIRVYPLEVPPAPGRFGSIYRCSTFMINAIERYEGPRDATRLSPHHHDDFEQCSLAVEGSFTHFFRWPWTPNMHDWRDDERESCGSVSAVVIPAGAIHTSRATGSGTNRLIDIFCPPRVDFSSTPGWVLNEADYPMKQAD